MIIACKHLKGINTGEGQELAQGEETDRSFPYGGSGGLGVGVGTKEALFLWKAAPRESSSVTWGFCLCLAQ